MTWTKATYLARTRDWMDATASDRWSDQFLYSLLGMAFRDEWQGALDTNPYYRFAKRSVTTDSNGAFALTALNAGGGDAQENTFKIITLTDGANTVYRETDWRQVPLALSGTEDYLSYDRQYYLIGETVQILPQTSGQSLQVGVNWIPTPIDELSSDLATVDFPAGHEHLLTLVAAGMALAKGGAETQSAGDILALAQQRRQAFYGDISRLTSNPTFMQFPDHASVWGG
jgi:hypothetical protein